MGLKDWRAAQQGDWGHFTHLNTFLSEILGEAAYTQTLHIELVYIIIIGYGYMIEKRNIKKKIFSMFNFRVIPLQFTDPVYLRLFYKHLRHSLIDWLFDWVTHHPNLQNTHLVPFGKLLRIGGAPLQTFPNVKYGAPEEVGGDRKCFDSPISKWGP